MIKNLLAVAILQFWLFIKHWGRSKRVLDMHTETIIIDFEFGHTWNQPQRQEPTFSWGIFSDPPWQPPTWPQGWEEGCWWWWPGPLDVETGSMFPHSRGWRGQRPHRSWCSQEGGGRPFHPHNPHSQDYDLCYWTLNVNTIRLSYSCCASYTFNQNCICYYGKTQPHYKRSQTGCRSL